MTATVVVVVALVLAPGAGAALAVAAPGAISIEARIALVFGLGYGLVAGTALALALAHVFTRLSFIATVALVTGAVWTLAWRRGPGHAHLSALRTQAREAPFTLGAGAALLLAVAAVWVALPSAVNLAHRSAWRYWADGLEVAAAGDVPAQSNQWGMEI